MAADITSDCVPLQSSTGDGGQAVNKLGYTAYPQGHWFKMGLKVEKTTQYGQTTYRVTYQVTALQLHHPYGESLLQLYESRPYSCTIPMENPYCSCKLTPRRAPVHPEGWRRRDRRRLVRPCR